MSTKSIFFLKNSVTGQYLDYTSDWVVNTFEEAELFLKEIFEMDFQYFEGIYPKEHEDDADIRIEIEDYEIIEKEIEEEDEEEACS